MTTENVKEEKTNSPVDNGPELTVQDLNGLKTIIDVASQRGAFKPNEMMTVGQIYMKLEQFLAAVASQHSQAKQG